MYSNSNHIFSQEGELSQSTPFSGHLEETNANEPLSNSNEHPQEYDFEYSRHDYDQMDQNDPEEPISSRADAICEENRRIRHIVESNLKKLEKKRLKLMESLSELDEQFSSKMEVHEAQAQQLIQLQMAHEEWTEKYKSELGQRPSLLEKMKHIQDFVEMFSNKYAEGVKFGDAIKNDLLKLNSELEDPQYQYINETKTKAIEFFKTEFEEQVFKAKQIRKQILQEREINISKVKCLALEKDDLSSKRKNLNDKLNYLNQHVEEMTTSCDKLDAENKSYKEKIANLHKDLYELRTNNALHIQDLKLQINTEENKNYNLESKSKEAEHSLNVLNSKQNVSRNLRDQLTHAIEESTKNIDVTVKEIEKHKEKVQSLEKEKVDLLDELKNYENVDEINKDLTMKIRELEDSNKILEINIKEKENTFALLSNELEEKRGNYHNVEENLTKLNEELDRFYKIRDELALKIKDDLASYEEERKRKISNNTNKEQINAELSLTINQMSNKLNEVKDHNESLNKTIDSIKRSIENDTENINNNNMKLNSIKEEWEDEMNAMTSDIDILEEELGYYEDLLIETKPKEDEIPELQKTKLSLEQQIQSSEENFKKEKESLENNFNAKLLEMDKEQEKFSSIMESLQLAEEEATDKLKVEIKETEQTKVILDNKLKSLQNDLHSLKLSEMSKRNQIVRIERRLETINKEMKVTRKDIADAITGKKQPIKMSRNVPVYGKENKVVKKGDDLSITSQVSTSKWVKQQASIDDYEFSDI